MFVSACTYYWYVLCQLLWEMFGKLGYLFIYNQIIHRVQQSKSKEQRAKLLHSCQVIYDAAKFIS